MPKGCAEGSTRSFVAKDYLAAKYDSTVKYDGQTAVQDSRRGTKESLEVLPADIVQLAMDLSHFPAAWKIIAKKALAYERKTGERKR